MFSEDTCCCWPEIIKDINIIEYLEILQACNYLLLFDADKIIVLICFLNGQFSTKMY